MQLTAGMAGSLAVSVLTLPRTCLVNVMRAASSVLSKVGGSAGAGGSEALLPAGPRRPAGCLPWTPPRQSWPSPPWTSLCPRLQSLLELGTTLFSEMRLFPRTSAPPPPPPFPLL